jgi:hypothetical protein
MLNDPQVRDCVEEWEKSERHTAHMPRAKEILCNEEVSDCSIQVDSKEREVIQGQSEIR